MTETIKTLLEPIQNRLNAAGKEPSRWLTGNDGNPVYYQSLGAKAVFIANAPTDQARLLAAVQAVIALHRMEFIEDGPYSRTRCEECLYEQEDAEECPTVAAITSALSEAR
jgi:hypothetical protein